MKHKYYRKVNDKFAKFNDWTMAEVQKVKELEERIVKFKEDQKAFIISSFRNMLAGIIEIDGVKPVLVDVGDAGDNPEEFREGRVDVNSALSFLMREDRVYSLDLLSQQLIEIERLHDTYNAKLLSVDNKSLLVVGGQSTKVQKPQTTQVKNEVCGLYWNDLSKQWRVSQKDYMKNPRVGFGATFAKGKQYAVVTGGFTTNFIRSKKTEVYNVAKDSWHAAHDLQVARTAHSMCEVSAGAYIYVFGGQIGDKIVDDTIERAEVSSAPAELERALGPWQLVDDIKLQMPLCNMGCLPLSKSEILLFGGLDSSFQPVKTGVVLMYITGSHNYLEDQINLLIPDQFVNTTQMHADEQTKEVLI